MIVARSMARVTQEGERKRMGQKRRGKRGPSSSGAVEKGIGDLLVTLAFTPHKFK